MSDFLSSNLDKYNEFELGFGKNNKLCQYSEIVINELEKYNLNYIRFERDPEYDGYYLLIVAGTRKDLHNLINNCSDDPWFFDWDGSIGIHNESTTLDEMCDNCCDSLNETYSKEELEEFVGKVFNQQKITKIFRRFRYGDTRLYAKTQCVNCGRTKKVFLSNLVNDPKKFGSCICSERKVDSRCTWATDLYNGNRKLRNNTSGYTGVSFIKSLNGVPYHKWRAYIEVDGERTYLGDFNSKAKAIEHRQEAAEKGIKWYKQNRNKLLRIKRKRPKKHRPSKYANRSRRSIMRSRKKGN